MDWNTYLRFPVAYKRWLIDRIGKEISKAAENKNDIPTKAPHHNTSYIRSLTGKTKPFQTPAKIQRFT
jgi:hypothetical protein